MDRRDFLKAGVAVSVSGLVPNCAVSEQVPSADRSEPKANPNWASLDYKATVQASSHSPDPSWGYTPTNILGDDLSSVWHSEGQTTGAWIEVGFPEERSVSEVWILSQPLPRDIRGQDVYLLAYSRVQWFEAPRHVRIGFSDGTSVNAELRQVEYFQVITLPEARQTSSVRITIEGVWPKTGAKESGIGKVRVFPFKHAASFEITPHKMYSVDHGQPMQSATLRLINPGQELHGSQFVVSQHGTVLMQRTLDPIPSSAMVEQSVWIPALFDDATLDFETSSRSPKSSSKRQLSIPTYHPTYFDGGTFSFNCTCHNDLGWLDTQEKTADFRSAEIILPALKLLKEYPEFMYSMESTIYLMEFLERHPELRDEMTEAMRTRRFTWGASYVQCQEVHVGPEKLVRQFYLGRRWLKKTFPGVDTRFYIKSDPPSMTLQMPQILKKAGLKYCVQGRMPYGFYNWQSPDGTTMLVYGYHYAVPDLLLNPRDNHGWLPYAEEREEYYRDHNLPRSFIQDYTSDYLPPQPDLPAYVRKQNAVMENFAAVWNKHFQNNPKRQIYPPKILFTTPEAFLDDFTKHPLNIPTLTGDWPFAWAYYDEPSNRDALLLGRMAHNHLLAGERMYAGLALGRGFVEYPAKMFEEAWKSTLWPDHGWGGNHGTLTDEIYRKSYAHAKTLSDKILVDAGTQLADRVARTANSQIPIVVFNPVSWERTDVVECDVMMPRNWRGVALHDEAGEPIEYEIIEGSAAAGHVKLLFIAKSVPSVGYRTYYVTPSNTKGGSSSPLTGNTMENEYLEAVFGPGGIKRLYDKQQKWEVLRTDKFDGGEILQFTAPGNAWSESPGNTTMQDFDRTACHDFAFKSFEKGAVRTTAVREAKFKNFTLRESFHLYEHLNRLDLDVEILDWDGTAARDLRVVFPINLDDARLSYEVPFGTVEMGKDELDFSLLPPDKDTLFSPQYYGGVRPIAYREAINWIDASSPNYLSSGCLAASDSTVHLFRDETTNPVTYPVLQHVLLSTRKSLAWNPDYSFTQAGSHRYRMSLLPHSGNWRLRYREGIGFNYPLRSFVGNVEGRSRGAALPVTNNYLRLGSPNLILTAMKKSEDDDRITIRFYEAEGEEGYAKIQMPQGIRQAWRTNLIEEDEEALQPLENGTLEFAVGPWEIVTIKVSV